MPRMDFMATLPAPFNAVYLHVDTINLLYRKYMSGGDFKKRVEFFDFAATGDNAAFALHFNHDYYGKLTLGPYLVLLPLLIFTLVNSGERTTVACPEAVQKLILLQVENDIAEYGIGNALFLLCANPLSTHSPGVFVEHRLLRYGEEKNDEELEDYAERAKMHVKVRQCKNLHVGHLGVFADKDFSAGRFRLMPVYSLVT
jgi:hypothetical protein